MKNLILAAAIILASTYVGFAQNTEKVLKMGKWYARTPMVASSPLIMQVLLQVLGAKQILAD